MTDRPPQRKSDRTRLQILESARAHFRARGFDGANLRSIGADASIDPAMVMRYFGSKEGLFAAAVDVDLQLPDLTPIAPDRRGFALVEHFIRRWEGDLSDDVLVLLLRSAVGNEKFAEQLRQLFSRQVVTMLTPVVAEAEVVRRAGLVSSQLLGVAVTRYILALPGMVEPPAQQLIADVAPTIQRYLYGVLD